MEGKAVLYHQLAGISAIPILVDTLDPGAFVAHRAWIGPMALIVLDDPDDPTPYWLVSTRHPDRVLSALRS